MQQSNVQKKSFSVGGIQCGIGNLLGFQQEDYDVRYIYDDRDFFLKNEETWRMNFPETKIDFFTDDFNWKTDVLISSPSCAQLSKLGVKRKDRLSLKEMKLDDFDFIKALKILFRIEPKFIVVEYLTNLTDYFTFTNNRITQRVTDEFIEIPEIYNWESIQLNSMNFGVSQNRKRLFLFFWKKEYKFKFNIPMFLSHEVKKAGELFKEIDSINGLDNQEPPKHSIERIKGFEALKSGESYYGTQNNKRIDPNKICPTIASSKTQHVHPWHPRVLTVRECATIQGFPYDFKFYGTFRDNLDLIGKTIPPPVAREIARQIKESLMLGEING